MASMVSVKLYFEAAHRLHNPERDDEWNREVYGKCNNLHGHGHNYVLEVRVRGAVNPETGYLIDMKVLKDVVRQRVVNDVDHRHLNLEVPWLENVIPSAENLAQQFFGRISGHLPAGVELDMVTVHETERNSASYQGGVA